MRIGNEVYTNLGRRGLLWSHCDSERRWTYSANPIAPWKQRLILQRGVLYAVEICRIKSVEANFGQIHVVETEHDHLDRFIFFQLVQLACVCSKTAGTPRVLGPEVESWKRRGPTRTRTTV